MVPIILLVFGCERCQQARIEPSHLKSACLPERARNLVQDCETGELAIPRGCEGGLQDCRSCRKTFDLQLTAQQVPADCPGKFPGAVAFCEGGADA